MTTKTIRITVNGDPIETYEMTRRTAESYLPAPQCPDPECRFGKRPTLPDDWDPNVLTIAHLVGVQVRARIIGMSFDFAQASYRMRSEAAMQIETALVATKLPSGAIGMAFRDVPVVIDETVPWVDFDVRTA